MDFLITLATLKSTHCGFSHLSSWRLVPQGPLGLTEFLYSETTIWGHTHPLLPETLLDPGLGVRFSVPSPITEPGDRERACLQTNLSRLLLGCFFGGLT
jgi:hypothetical protein